MILFGKGLKEMRELKELLLQINDKVGSQGAEKEILSKLNTLEEEVRRIEGDYSKLAKQASLKPVPERKPDVDYRQAFEEMEQRLSWSIKSIINEKMADNGARNVAEQLKAENIALAKENAWLRARIAELERKAPQLPSPKADPFRIVQNKDKVDVTKDRLQEVLAGFCDTSIIDGILEKVPDDDSYKKLFQYYKKNIQKRIRQCDSEEELEDTLNQVLSVVQDSLLKKIVVALYRGIKMKQDGLERQLLDGLNKYLEANGFYIRDDLVVGRTIQEKDYDDMYLIKDDRAQGRTHGEITEIELYPYYLNFIDEEGDRKDVHTQGTMVVIA